MKYAVIEDGKVVNIADADPEFAEKMGWIPGEDCRIGDLLEAGKFITPAPEPVVNEPEPMSQMDRLLTALLENKAITEDQAKAIKQ